MPPFLVEFTEQLGISQLKETDFIEIKPLAA